MGGEKTPNPETLNRPKPSNLSPERKKIAGPYIWHANASDAFFGRSPLSQKESLCPQKSGVSTVSTSLGALGFLPRSPSQVKDEEPLKTKREAGEETESSQCLLPVVSLVVRYPQRDTTGLGFRV